MFLSRLQSSARSSSKTAFSRLSGRTAAIAKTPVTVGKAFTAMHVHAAQFSTAVAPKVVAADMFCRQCEQTKDHFACTSVGICGKTAETAACQDTLMEVIKSVSTWADAARKAGVSEADLKPCNVWTLAAVFSTVTNVNFSDERIADYIWQGSALQKDLRKLLKKRGAAAPKDRIANLDVGGMSVMELEDFGRTVSVPIRQAAMNQVDAFSLNEIATYGLKGACAYAMHCHQLGVMDEQVMTNIHSIFRKLASDEPDMEGLLATVMKVGETNTVVLKNLDEAHANTLGAPEPTPVRTSAVEGKCILVSGHDMKDLYELLKQTEGKGINVYTHGEMQPAHAYPKLKAFSHLVGNYGTAWQSQK
jgi:hydroxylamine reductase